MTPEEKAIRAECYAVYRAALKSGVLVRPDTCQGCGREKTIHKYTRWTGRMEMNLICGHHPDYSRPLAVVWLCTYCHGLLHAELKDAGYGGRLAQHLLSLTSEPTVSLVDHWYDAAGRLRLTVCYEQEQTYEMDLPNGAVAE